MASRQAHTVQDPIPSPEEPIINLTRANCPSILYLAAK